MTNSESTVHAEEISRRINGFCRKITGRPVFGISRPIEVFCYL